MGEGPSHKSVVVGQMAGAHGVKGAFKLRSFTERPQDVAAYGPLHTPDGRRLTVTLLRELKPSLFLATAPEIASREAVDAFKGARLSVPRDRLPGTEEDEYYLDDLVGLPARTQDGEPAGQVKAVVNYGAGDIVELSGVPGRKGAVLIAFTKEDVPEVSLSTGIVVVLPEEDDAQPPPREED